MVDVGEASAAASGARLTTESACTLDGQRKHKHNLQRQSLSPPMSSIMRSPTDGRMYCSESAYRPCREATLSAHPDTTEEKEDVAVLSKDVLRVS